MLSIPRTVPLYSISYQDDQLTRQAMYVYRNTEERSCNHCSCGRAMVIKSGPSNGPEGPATGHLDTGFSWFPCVYKQMLRWFPRFQVATTCFSCSPPDLNLLFSRFVDRASQYIYLSI